jgi:plastocyanin
LKRDEEYPQLFEGGRNVKVFFFAAAISSACLAGDAMAVEVTVEIRGNGQTAQYVQTVPPAPLANTQLNVVVSVGDTVKWHNAGNIQHTAHSDLKLPDGMGGFRFLIAKTIAAGADGSHTFSQDDYDKARASLGIAAGEPVHLGYYCANHPDKMGGKIVLLPTEDLKRRFMAERKNH